MPVITPELDTIESLAEAATTTGLVVAGRQNGQSVQVPAALLAGAGTPGPEGPEGPQGPQGTTGAAGTDGTVPWIDAPVTGRHYPLTGIPLALAPTTLAGAANRGDLSPWLCSRTITPAGIGVVVTTGVAGASLRVLVYSSDASGWPDALLWDSGSLTATTSTQYREGTASVPTFTKGVLYWLGVLHSSTATVRAHALGSAMQIGGVGATATTGNFGSIVRRTGLTFASPPNPWGFSASQITNNVAPPMVLARAA